MKIGVALQVVLSVALDRTHGEVRQVREEWGLVPEVLAVLAALGVKVLTVLVAIVVCMSVMVEVQPTLGVLGCEWHLGPYEVSRSEVLLLNLVQCVGYLLK